MYIPRLFESVLSKNIKTVNFFIKFINIYKKKKEILITIEKYDLFSIYFFNKNLFFVMKIII